MRRSVYPYRYAGLIETSHEPSRDLIREDKKHDSVEVIYVMHFCHNSIEEMIIRKKLTRLSKKKSIFAVLTD